MGQWPTTAWFDQQAFVKAIGTAVAVIVQANAVAATTARTSSTVGQGGTSNLQRFQAHHPLTYMGVGDLMVRTALVIERELEDARSIQDTGASGKRKKDQPSSSSGKKQKTSTPRGFQKPGRHYQGQGQTRASNQSGSMTCFHYHQPGHVRGDFPQRQRSQGHETPQSQSSMGQGRT